MNAKGEGAPPRPEPKVGAVAVCNAGRLGRIEGRAKLPWGFAWVGVGVIDGEPWSSRDPRVLSDDEAMVIETLVSEAYG